jgi:DNA-binding PadR family transcriptional regulator
MSVKRSNYVSALSPEYALLGLLAQKPSHGYELHRRLVNNLGQIWHISLSQTYNILKRLEQYGYIGAEMQEQEKLPARRMYSLKPAGEARFKKWLQAPSGSSVRAIRIEFTTRLYFAVAKDCALADQLITNQIAEVNEGLARLRIELARVPEEQLFNQLGLELRINQLESILQWLEGCQRRICERQGKAR